MKNFAQRYAHWNWAILDQALVSGTNFFVGILLVRYIGLEQYGRFVLAWMVVQFFASVQNALVVSPMLSIAPKIPLDERGSYFSATLLLQGGLTLIITALVVISFAVPEEYRPIFFSAESILPIALCLGSVQIQDYIRRQLFAQLAARQAFQLDMVAYGAQLPLIFIVLRASPSFENALLVMAGAMMCANLLGCRWINISRISKAKLGEIAVRHWRSSKWLLGSAVLQWMSGNYFMVVGGIFLGPTIVGSIRAAQNLLGLTHVIFQGLDNIIPGELSHKYQIGGFKALFHYCAWATILLSIGTGLLAALVAMCSEPLLRVVYGSFDQTSAYAIGWFVPIYVMVAVTLPLRAALRTLEHTGAIFVGYIISAVFALSAAQYFINHYNVGGIMAGMAIIQVITTCVLSASLYLEFRAKWNSEK